jgi:hypothetical protein
MSGYLLNDQNLVGQTGSNQLSENTLTAPARLILVPRGSFIDTEANARLLATWVTKCKAVEVSRFKPIKIADMTAPTDIEGTVKERPFLGGKQMFLGKTSFTYDVDATYYYAKELAKLNGYSWDAYIVDANGNICGISTNGVKFEPRKILTLQVLPPKTAAPGENVVTQISVIFGDTQQWQTNMVAINPEPTWSALTDIDGVHNIDLAASGNWSATGGVFTASYSDSGRPVSGLVAADFTIAGKVISSVTESTTVPGTYTLVGVSLTTLGVLNLVACSAVSLTTVNIECLTGATFTIPA